MPGRVLFPATGLVVILLLALPRLATALPTLPAGAWSNPFAPLLARFTPHYSPDVRLSNPTLNGNQHGFQIGIDPQDSQIAVGVGTGPGEPCDPQARPYFRANADVTRGQLSKIVVQAAQYGDVVPTTQQTFADVPAGNAFWVFIERLASRGIISGYTCGGPGEPCDPQGRPYFRWGAPATRGQMAKIPAQTFFPNCHTPASSE